MAPVAREMNRVLRAAALAALPAALLSCGALQGCDGKDQGGGAATTAPSTGAPAAPAGPNADGSDPTIKYDTTVATIAGKSFTLQIADDDRRRIKGLGGRTSIAEFGGMVFVFPAPQPLSFVMRDCPIPIDVLFLDGAGRVLTIHAMTPENPKRADEDPLNYERRLRQYPSRYPSQLVVELRGGRAKELGVKAGDLIGLDVAALKKRAKASDAGG